MTPVPGGPPAVVGLERERQVLTVALAAGRHVVIEGPPGTGKSTLLRDIAREAGQRVIFVEGNAELTPARLVGQYDPAQVLARGYVPDSFTDGPLLQAMRGGALLYLEEFNRIPEETLNVLITVLAEGEIAVPRLGMVAADAGFRLIAAMNPFDAIGTARVSQAVADRICRVVLGYQDAAAEQKITAAAAGENGEIVEFAVSLTRATRDHPDVRMGASVRGAIDLVLLAAGLARLRTEQGLTRETARDAAWAALSGRIRIADGCDRSPESVIDELLGQVWPTRPAPAAPAAGPAQGPGGLPVRAPGEGPADADGLAEMPGEGEGEAAGPAEAPGDGREEAGGRAEAPGDGRKAADGRDEADGQEEADGPAEAPGDGRGWADGARALRAAGRPVRGTSRSSLRRGRQGGPRRTASRAELAARHPGFASVSPAVGRLDRDALARLLAADPDAAATLLADLALATDRELADAARRLAARVFVRLAAFGGDSARGTRRLCPGTVTEGDLDLDRTLDRLSGSWPPAGPDLVTRSWRAHRRSLCLLIDTSGSMSGLAVAIAAVAAAAVLLAADGRLDPAVVAFGSEATVLRAAGSARVAGELVGDLIALRGHGMTDLAAGLRAAGRELAGSPPGERVAVLVSDCLRTAGGDPAPALAGVDRLHVLCPLPTPDAERAASALARLGGGTSQPVRGLADVAPALTRALSA